MCCIIYCLFLFRQNRNFTGKDYQEEEMAVRSHALHVDFFGGVCVLMFRRFVCFTTEDRVTRLPCECTGAACKWTSASSDFQFGILSSLITRQYSNADRY